MKATVKLPTAETEPSARVDAVHIAPCKLCPSAHNAASGEQDPESLDIKAGPRSYQLQSVFPCAWRPKKNCKGYCDFLGVTEADLTQAREEGIR